MTTVLQKGFFVANVFLMDVYAPFFFLNLATMPGRVCDKVNPFQDIAIVFFQVQANSCELSKDTISAILAKLDGLNTALAVIKTLLKMCNSVR